jgi:hypothetical protein
MFRAAMYGLAVLGAPGWCLAQNADQFAVGTAFKGSRWFADARGKIDTKNSQGWSLKVTERNGNGFEGEITLEFKDGPASYPVKGKAPAAGNGAVTFVGEKGLFKQQFKGLIKKGEIGLEFSGRAVGGIAVRGTALLRPGQ